jgi:antibiotic biosynthesis monooxygenase (ABM) superfamily enzyme
VKPGREAEFEALLKRIADEAVRFPGHQGVQTSS